MESEFMEFNETSNLDDEEKAAMVALERIRAQKKVNSQQSKEKTPEPTINTNKKADNKDLMSLDPQEFLNLFPDPNKAK